MDTAAFRSDLELIPETLGALADAVDAGLDGLDRLPMLAASRVLVLGMGSSRYAADVVARRYRAVDAQVMVELASVALLPPAAPDLAVVAVSATGGSVEVLRAIERYRGTGRLVAVTNRADSELARAADVVVPLHAGVEASGVACRTFRATFAVLDQVLAELLGTAPEARFDPAALRAAADTSAHLLEASADWLAPMADLLAGPMGTWALAPAERASSAQQSALMLREVPRRAAFASETGDWSHVDVYLTKTQDYRALVFAGSAWDAQALEWMAMRSSRFASIGRDLPGAELTLRFPGDEDDTVAALSEVLVGELVADHWLRQG
ncbi:sigma factor regulator FecR [Agromyces rhizosphaerae]|uniref:Glutamine--fructose-6-phosphate aminotransferase [isomerizing] n=1 Tax=Agromyces rhizosphaerae TaxID=88374 RepID=A0A9W6CQ63_9MICO|nr:SIS domain-containing protein [Agromyces rhizosphaerae]GLI26816.1 sigma factor regulator FecR [Agromyces rhizosphaerae]